MLDTEIKPGYDRVTDILYAFSGLSKIDPDVLKKAADRGTFVHLQCDCVIDDLPVDDSKPEFIGYVDSFKQWAEGRKFLNKPQRFYDDELMITGECDGLYEEDGGRVLFDIKTPARESITWPLQAAAYAYLAKKNGITIDRLEFVKLNKNGDEPLIYIYGDDSQEFMTCLHVYRKYFNNSTTDLTDF